MAASVPLPQVQAGADATGHEAASPPLAAAAGGESPPTEQEVGQLLWRDMKPGAPFTWPVGEMKSVAEVVPLLPVIHILVTNAYFNVTGRITKNTCAKLMWNADDSVKNNLSMTAEHAPRLAWAKEQGKILADARAFDRSLLQCSFSATSITAGVFAQCRLRCSFSCLGDR